MTKEELEALRPGIDRIRFPPWTGVWDVAEIVERGLVLWRYHQHDHKHLLEWHELTDAEKV